jgi:hypothetical protein
MKPVLPPVAFANMEQARRLVSFWKTRVPLGALHLDTARDQLVNQHDHGNHQEEMDQGATNLGYEKSTNPHYDEQHDKRPEHCFLQHTFTPI